MKQTPAERMTKEFLALRDSIADDSGGEFFELSHPGMWLCAEGEWTEHPHTHQDVYLLIRGFALSASRGDDFAHLDGIALVTCGWAAPLPVEWNGDNDSAIGRPSEHADRVRCALVMTVARDGSVYSHLDVQGRETSGESYGRGGLLSAVDYLGLGVWKREYSQGVLRWYAELRAEAEAAGDVLDDHITRFFAERIAGMLEILGHDTDETDSALS